MIRETTIMVNCPKREKMVDLDHVCWNCDSYEGFDYNVKVECTYERKEPVQQ